MVAGEAAVRRIGVNLFEYQDKYDRYVYIMTGDSMILSEPADTHLTVFNPDEELLKLVRELAAREGLFVWQPPQ